jgi:hypothetical protein
MVTWQKSGQGPEVGREKATRPAGSRKRAHRGPLLIDPVNGFLEAEETLVDLKVW